MMPRRGFSNWLMVCFTAIALCFSGESATASSPTLGSIQPRGAKRGTDVTLIFSGSRLGDAQEVLVYYPGITIKKIEPVNDNQIKVIAAIAPDCRLGEHALRVRTATGISDVRTVFVGALPVIDEVEPNSDIEKPQPVALNTTVHGVVQAEDQDFFVVECKKGQRLSVEVEGMRLGVAFFDPYVAILDAKRFELATSDDSPLCRQDGGCSTVIPADGKYIVQIRESAYGGSGGSQYRLHIGNFPRPTAILPAGGKPGEELEVTFLGDPSGPIKQRVKVPLLVGDPQWRLHCQTTDGISPTGFEFRISNLPNTLESASNHTAAAATPGTVPGAFNGIIAKAGETDYFKFEAKKGQVFNVRCYARQIGSPLDSVLHIGKADGAALANNDDSGGPDSSIRFTVPADGTYTIFLHDHLRKGGADYFYRIEVTPIEPLITTSIYRVDRNNPANQERQSITIPKGNRYATLLVANRSDFGGPVTMGFGKLPAGVSLNAEAMEPGLNIVPVVFEANGTAPTAGHLTTITATPTDPKVKVPSRTEFDTALVIGQPGQTVYTRHNLEQAAIAVAEPCPFSIEVIEPKVPIVQNGVYNLRVVAKRAEGFKGAITVSPLFTPPGMGIQNSATIAPEATEVYLSMNAAGNAAPRKWKTVITAVSDYGKGPTWVSSQLFTLEIAAPPVTLTAERPAVEQGTQTQLFCKVAVAVPFAGKAKVKLLGLPAKVGTQEMELTKDTKELVFPIIADKTSPVGKHGGIFCQITIEQNGELITLNTGGTELRIDAPLPPKVASTPKPAPKGATKPQPAGNQPPKRLSRLEQLRQDQAEREKQSQSGGAKEAPKKP